MDSSFGELLPVCKLPVCNGEINISILQTSHWEYKILRKMAVIIVNCHVITFMDILSSKYKIYSPTIIIGIIKLSTNQL